MLIGYVIIYVVPGVLALAAVIRLLTTKGYNGKLKASIVLAMVICFWSYLTFYHYDSENKAVRAQVGTYQLTHYPGCYPCELELKEDNKFVVRQHNSIRETGTWRFESGQDYWITYLNESGQLGTGNYRYQENHLKHSY